MLRGMQHTVNRTVDADQRARKSQALNLLLGMFERVLEERHVVDQDHSNRMEMDRLKERFNWKKTTKDCIPSADSEMRN